MTPRLVFGALLVFGIVFFAVLAWIDRWRLRRNRTFTIYDGDEDDNDS